MKSKKSGTSQYPGGRQTNNRGIRVLFARYSRVSRDIRELFGATNNLLIRRLSVRYSCLFGAE